MSCYQSFTSIRGSPVLWSVWPPASVREIPPHSSVGPGSGSWPTSRIWTGRRSGPGCVWNWRLTETFKKWFNCLTRSAWGRRWRRCWGWGSCSPGRGRARAGTRPDRREDLAGSQIFSWWILFWLLTPWHSHSQSTVYLGQKCGHCQSSMKQIRYLQ